MEFLFIVDLACTAAVVGFTVVYHHKLKEAIRRKNTPFENKIFSWVLDRQMDLIEKKVSTCPLYFEIDEGNREQVNAYLLGELKALEEAMEFIRSEIQ